MRELRHKFHQALETINGRVLELFQLIPEDLKLATDALLDGDSNVLKTVNEREETIDLIYLELEGLTDEQFALQGPMADDLRLLLTVLRVVPELERSHDLVVSIAEHATHSLQASLSPRTHGLVTQMADTSVEMWNGVGRAWKNLDPSIHPELIARDDEIDNLHSTLMAELASGTMPLAVAMDMTLVGRFYERLGAHAINISRRVLYLVGK